jgi:helix-turn-helix protein
MSSYQMPRRFTEREGAEFLGIQYQTLKNWRAASQGPAFYRVGTKIVYSEKDLTEWMDARRVPTASDRILVSASA